MILTEKQQKGLELAVERFHAGKPYTVISGYAGSGKTTLVKFIIAALQLNPEEDVAYVAYTGKAANVLSRKGNPNATTAHKLLYEAKPKSDGTFFFTKKYELDKDYQLIIVDEVSMLPAGMWNTLLSHRIPIIACGDPGQLPPINKDDDNHVLDNPHIFLDEIMRQAADSEIIQLSMHVRENKPISNFETQGAQVKVINKSDITIGMYEWADQILCATNKTRNDVNMAIRKNNGFGTEPQEGDKVICARNSWDTLSTTYQPLTNGTNGILKNLRKTNIFLPRYISTNGAITVLIADIETEYEGIFKNIMIDYKALTTGEKTLTPKQEYQMNQSKRLPDAPFEFAYGYAITCHRAQGSEWEKVMVMEENFPFDKEEHKRWLYTAATRASEKLVVVKK